MTIQMHSAFQVNRPDEVAECWQGVTDDLYKAKLNDLAARNAFGAFGGEW